MLSGFVHPEDLGVGWSGDFISIARSLRVAAVSGPGLGAKNLAQRRKGAKGNEDSQPVLKMIRRHFSPLAFLGAFAPLRLCARLYWIHSAFGVCSSMVARIGLLAMTTSLA